MASVTSGEGKNKEIGPFKQLWKTDPIKLVLVVCLHIHSHKPIIIHTRPGSEFMYGFSEFTASLNEPEEGIAPTDSRLRPDQRIMEEQDFDKANSEKVGVIIT